MIRFLLALAFTMAMAACGGGGAPVATQALPAADPPAAAPPGQPAAPSAPAASSPVTAIAVTPVPVVWQEVWREDWSAPSWGGWLRDTVDGPECSDAPGALVPGWPSPGTWYGGDSGLPRLRAWSNFSTHSAATFPVDRRVRLTGVVDLLQDDRAWVGLTLIHASNSYVEVALNWEAGRLYVERYSGCSYEVLAEVQPGPQSIGVDHDAGMCTYYSGIKVLQRSACTLRGDPRVGIYSTNFGGGPVRADFGLLTVEVAK